MRITAHRKFRLSGICFLLGFHDLDPRRAKAPIFSSRSYVNAEPGDVIEGIWEMDGVWIKEIEGEIPNHPLLQDIGDATFRLDVECLERDYELPVEISGLMTIED